MNTTHRKTSSYAPTPLPPIRNPLTDWGLCKYAQPLSYKDYVVTTANVVLDVGETYSDKTGVLRSSGVLRLRLSFNNGQLYEYYGQYSCAELQRGKGKRKVDVSVQWKGPTTPDSKNVMAIVSGSFYKITQNQEKDADKRFRNYTHYTENVIKAIVERGMFVKSVIRIKDNLKVLVKKVQEGFRESNWVFLSNWLQEHKVKKYDVIRIMVSGYNAGIADEFVIAEDYDPATSILKGVFRKGRSIQEVLEDMNNPAGIMNVNVNAALIDKKSGIIYKIQ